MDRTCFKQFLYKSTDYNCMNNCLEKVLLPGSYNNYMNYSPANYVRNNFVDHGTIGESLRARAVEKGKGTAAMHASQRKRDWMAVFDICVGHCCSLGRHPGKRVIYALPLFLAMRHVSGERGGGVYWRAPVPEILYTPLFYYTFPPLGVCSGVGGGGGV